LRAVRAHQIPYYDALIWASARMNGIPFLLSEDGQDGRNIEGVRTLNPLKTSFDLDLLR
jgi:predicted nucleic acid-binding protein